MEKVKCVKCGSYGYTASPGIVRCSECGGRHVIVKEDRRGKKCHIEPVSSYLKRLLLDYRAMGVFKENSRLTQV